MTSDQNKYTCLVDSGAQVSTISLEHAKELGLEIFDEYGNIVSQRDALKEPKTTSTKKKSRYDAKHRIKGSSKLEKRLKKLENRFDILDDDLFELKLEIDDIKKSLSRTKHNTSSDSSESEIRV